MIIASLCLVPNSDICSIASSSEFTVLIDNIKYGKEKIDKIINFLINHFSTEELLDVFSYKSYAMLMKLDYSLEDNFLEIKTENISLVKKSLKNYQRIKDDRNNINHANRKNLSSVEELGKFIKDSIKQIKNI